MYVIVFVKRSRVISESSLLLITAHHFLSLMGAKAHCDGFSAHCNKNVARNPCASSGIII